MLSRDAPRLACQAAAAAALALWLAGCAVAPPAASGSAATATAANAKSAVDPGRAAVDAALHRPAGIAPGSSPEAAVVAPPAAESTAAEPGGAAPADPGPPPQVGVASWYGLPFHGRRTANGERYDMNALTAAHPSLPLHSFVQVRNLGNRREIVVRINDRGPFKAGRIIDLSRAAARSLGVDGLAQVEVLLLRADDLRVAVLPAGLLSPAPPAPPGRAAKAGAAPTPARRSVSASAARRPAG